MHKLLRTPIVRQQSFCQRLNVTLARVATLFGIEIALYDDQFTAPRATSFIQPYTCLYHLSWFPTSWSCSNHLLLLFFMLKMKALLSITTRTLLNRALVAEHERAALLGVCTPAFTERQTRQGMPAGKLRSLFVAKFAEVTPTEDPV
jgi:hypothetical protein